MNPDPSYMINDNQGSVSLSRDSHPPPLSELGLAGAREFFFDLPGGNWPRISRTASLLEISILQFPPSVRLAASIRESRCF